MAAPSILYQDLIMIPSLNRFLLGIRLLTIPESPASFLEGCLWLKISLLYRSSTILPCMWLPPVKPEASYMADQDFPQTQFIRVQHHSTASYGASNLSYNC